MTYEQGDDCRGSPGFVGCPHCDGPVDVRAETHAAIGDFLDYLLLSLKHAEGDKKKLDRVWATARERRWWHLEHTFPFDLLAPFWDDSDDEPPSEAAKVDAGAEVGGATGTDPAHRALLPRGGEPAAGAACTSG